MTVVLERPITIGVLVDDLPTQVTLLGGHGLLRTFKDASPGDLFEFSVEKVSGWPSVRTSRGA